MANNSYKRNQNLVATNINNLNLSGDGHIHGILSTEDIRVNDTLISNIVVGTEHITTPQIIIDEDDGVNINMNGHKIINVGEPEDDNDVTTKKFVEDIMSSGLTNPLNSDLDLNTNNILNINNIDGIQYGQTIKQRLGVDNSIIEFNNKLCIEGNTVTPTEIGKHINGTSLPSDELIIEGSIKMNSKQYNLSVGGNIETFEDINAKNITASENIRQSSSTVDGVSYFTNSSVKSEGLNNFKVYPSSTSSTFVYKRVSAFNKTFNANNQTFDVTIPDCLFYPEIGSYTKGVGMVKICFSIMGFTDQGETLGGIHYKEILVIVRHSSTDEVPENASTGIHEIVHKQIFGNTEYVNVITRYINLETGIPNGPLVVGTDAAIGVTFISKNLSNATYKSILKGTIEAI